MTIESRDTYDITIYCGETFTRTMLITDDEDTPIDLTNYDIRLIGRKLNTTGEKLIEANIDNGFITFFNSDPTLGKIEIVIPATTTKDINNNKETSGPYSIEFENSSGIVKKWVSGIFYIKPEANYD